MYTIKSISSEGEYYLVNHWDKYKAFWQKKSRISSNRVFKNERSAKTSLTKLLMVMPEYLKDQFMMVRVRLRKDGRIEDVENLYKIELDRKYA